MSSVICAHALPAVKAHRHTSTAKARGAPGIVAESPQDLHKQIRGLGAESPVCGVSRKGAKIPNLIPNRNKITNVFLKSFL
jgi:hypothetical protein